MSAYPVILASISRKLCKFFAGSISNHFLKILKHDYNVLSNVPSHHEGKEAGVCLIFMGRKVPTTILYDIDKLY